MLIYPSNEELELWTKKQKVAFVLKKQNLKNGSTRSPQMLDKHLGDMLDTEIVLKYDELKDEIEKETWIECYPDFYHITEFEQKLKELLALYDSREYLNIREQIDTFYSNLNKTVFDDLTLEEKTDLYRILDQKIY